MPFATPWRRLFLLTRISNVHCRGASSGLPAWWSVPALPPCHSLGSHVDHPLTARLPPSLGLCTVTPSAGNTCPSDSTWLVPSCSQISVSRWALETPCLTMESKITIQSLHCINIFKILYVAFVAFYLLDFFFIQVVHDLL